MCDGLPLCVSENAVKDGMDDIFDRATVTTLKRVLV